MPKCFVARLVLILAGFLAGPALGQQPTSPIPTGMSISLLVTNKSVQEELKLDKERIAKVQAALVKVREDHAADLEKLRDLGLQREERARLMAKVGEAMAAAVRDVLTAEQMTRLRQIHNQLRGTELFTDPRVQKDLNLTAEQKEKFRTMDDDLRHETGEILQGALGNPDGLKDAQK